MSNSSETRIGSRNSSLGDSADRDPVEELAAEFAERYRNGDEVSIDDYVRKYPAFAEDIRELFPTIAAMERLGTKRIRDAAMEGRMKPKQLGDFRIVDEIARGGMGIVYEAEQVSLDRRVAVKILPSHAFSRQKDVQRFYREAKTAAGLHHSNIVPVFGVGEEKGQHYIVMQLIRGVGLDEVLGEIKRIFVEGSSSDKSSTSVNRFNAIARSAANLVESDLQAQSTRIRAELEDDTVEVPMRSGKMARRLIKPTALRASLGKDYFRNVAKIGLQAAQALDYAHAHETLHRDIKPGNLILDENGRVWVADFGLAKVVADDDVTRSGDIVGTIAYVAPERFKGKTTKSSDIYSLGVTLHEMLTLQKAFTGQDRVEVLSQVTHDGITPPSKLNPSVPRDLETIVMKAAASETTDRYRSAGALARDLQAFLEDRPIEARRLSHIEHGYRWCRRNRLTTAMACGIILLIGSVIGLLASGYRDAELGRQREESQRLRAERVADEAIGFIDGIYEHFAPAALSDASLADNSIDAGLSNGNGEPREETPISKDTAIMLENLLEFYDNFADDAADTNLVAIKRISASRRVADLHHRLDQLQDAKDSYQEAIRRIGALPESLRKTAAMRIETARVHNGLGLASRDANAHRSARDVLSEEGSREERFELATTQYFLHVAEVFDWRFRGGRGQRNKLNNAESETNSLKNAKVILNQLLKESPEQADYKLLLAKCLLFERDFRRGKEASGDRLQAIDILSDLVLKHPDRPEFQYEFGRVLLKQNRYVTLLRFRRRPDESQLSESSRELQRALDATADLEVSHPNIPKYYQLKKELNECLALVLHMQGELAESDSRFERAIQMQRLLIAHAEDQEKHRPWLHFLQIRRGHVLVDEENYQRAEELLSSSVAKLERIIEESPNDHERGLPSFHGFMVRVAEEHLDLAYGNLAKISRELGNESAAQAWSKKLMP